MYTRLYMYVTVIIHVSTHASSRHNVDLLYSSNVYVSFFKTFISEHSRRAVVGHRYDDNGKYDSRHISSFIIQFENDPDSRIHCMLCHIQQRRNRISQIDFLLLNVGNKIGNSMIAAHIWGSLIMYLNCKRITTGGHLLGLTSVQSLLYIEVGEIV